MVFKHSFDVQNCIRNGFGSEKYPGNASNSECGKDIKKGSQRIQIKT